MAERRCRHYIAARRRSCGAVPVHLYIVGWRCPEHTPAALAGLPEPGCGPECGPATCRCPNGDGWWQYLRDDVQDALRDPAGVDVVANADHPQEVAVVLRRQELPRGTTARTLLRTYDSELRSAGFATRVNASSAAVIVTYGRHS